MLLQFLIETVVLTALGGLICIALATAASLALSGLRGVPYLFNPRVNLRAFVFSAGIGVVLGYFWPAVQRVGTLWMPCGTSEATRRTLILGLKI